MAVPATSPRGATVAVDGDVLGLGAARQLRDRARALPASRCAPTSTSSPAPGRSGRRRRPRRSTSTRAPRSAASRAASKLRRVRAAMREAGATHHFVSTVDDLAWIAQPARRRRQLQPGVPRPPADRRRHGDAVRRRGQGRRRAAPPRSPPTASRLAPYEQAGAALAALPDERHAAARSEARDARPARAAPGRRVVEAINPSTLAKSRKSDAEAAHVRRAMAEDGAAMCEFYAWFEAALADPARRAAHRADDRREADRGARQAPRLRRPELRDHRRLQRQRRDAALPRHPRVARRRSPATACC